MRAPVIAAVLVALSSFTGTAIGAEQTAFHLPPLKTLGGCRVAVAAPEGWHIADADQIHAWNDYSTYNFSLLRKRGIWWPPGKIEVAITLYDGDKPPSDVDREVRPFQTASGLHGVTHYWLPSAVVRGWCLAIPLKSPKKTVNFRLAFRSGSLARQRVLASEFFRGVELLAPSQDHSSAPDPMLPVSVPPPVPLPWKDRPSTRISVSPDDRYVVSINQEGLGADLHDRVTGRTTGLIGWSDPIYYRSDFFHAADCQAVWSQKNLYVALSMNRMMHHSMGEPISPARLASDVSVFRIVDGDAFPVQTVDNQVRYDPGKEEIDHWDAANGLWTFDRKTQTRYCYRLIYRDKMVLRKMLLLRPERQR